MITYRLGNIYIDEDFYTVHGNASEQSPNGQFTEIGLKFSLPVTPDKTVAQISAEFLELAKRNIPCIYHPE